MLLLASSLTRRAGCADDLVLDFTIAMHTEEELTQAHQKVVNSFRANRTVSPAGVAAWSRMNRKDPTTLYVLAEVEHHCRNTIDTDRISADPLSQYSMSVVDWMKDQPHDTICDATANILGVPLLSEMGAAYDSAGDYWSAACVWGATAVVELGASGRDAALVMGRKCMDSFHKMDMGASPGCTQDAADQLEMRQLCMIGMGLQGPDVEKYFDTMKRHEHLMTTKAARACPQDAMIINVFGRAFTKMITDKLPEAMAICLECMIQLNEDGVENAVDPLTQEFCAVLCGGLFGWYCSAMFFLLEDFRMSKYPWICDVGRKATYTYDYDTHHLEMVNFCNNDLLLSSPACIVPCGFHQGDLTTCHHAIDLCLSGLKRIKGEPDQGAEAFGFACGLLGDMCAYAYILGKGADVITLHRDIGFTCVSPCTSYNALLLRCCCCQNNI